MRVLKKTKSMKAYIHPCIFVFRCRGNLKTLVIKNIAYTYIYKVLGLKTYLLDSDNTLLLSK